MSSDPRLDAFLSERTEVFHSVQHRQEIWRNDPFDVETLHEEARTLFQRLLTRATLAPGPSSGRILLLLGASGCGKTHLVRAFRGLAHGQKEAFVGYMQMTTATQDYSRYILVNLIESLEHPYDESREPTSALMRLSDALHARCGPVSALLREPEQLEEDEVHELVHSSADLLLKQPDFARVDVDLLRALLYLQRDDARIQSRVLKYLRCENLSELDRKVLGGLVPRIHDDDPPRMVEHLGRIMGALHHALVLCVDQLEDIYDPDDARKPFRQAMQAVCALADRVPSAVVVICCLQDFWAALKPSLTQSMLDRIEKDPQALKLEDLRTAEEARQIISRRLAHLYEQEGVAVDETDPTFPFPAAGFERLSGLRTRDVLNECRRYREQAAREGHLPDAFPLSEKGEVQTALAPIPQPTFQLDQAWNDFRTSQQPALVEDEGSLAELLAWALKAGAEEFATGHRLEAMVVGKAVFANVTPGERLHVAICNSSPRGGGLNGQIERARAAAQDRKTVIVRSSSFPDSPNSKTARQLGELISAGGRRTVLEDSEARTLLALREFRGKNEARPDFAGWVREARPVTRLKAVRDILDLERLEREPLAPPHGVAPGKASVPEPEPEPVSPPPSQASAPPRAPLPIPEGSLTLGRTDGLFPEPLLVSSDELTRHSAFLGGTGSGKTTLALNLVEQLLVRGIPAILVDRKGDLAGYATDTVWTKPLEDPGRAERRRMLEGRLEVALFTPGHPQGRPLAIPIVPRGLGELPAFDRELAVDHAAQALGGMLDYKSTGRDKQCRTVLSQALNLLVQSSLGGELSLEQVIQFIESQDPILMNKVGRLDTKLLGKLVQDLETLKLSASTLLGSGGERLDMELLLGRGAYARPGRTRLSVISTRFLGDTPRILFWVSQLLIEVSRWTSRTPSNQLQAVLMLDEADLYLPATQKPATKQPIENLLKRARSAGLGLMLATQSPGDLDYKCRDTLRNWFVGRVKENNSLQKMKPMLSEARVDFSAKIPAQATGEFHVLRDGKVERLKADPSVLTTEQLSEEELVRLARRTLEPR